MHLFITTFLVVAALLCVLNVALVVKGHRRERQLFPSAPPDHEPIDRPVLVVPSQGPYRTAAAVNHAELKGIDQEPWIFTHPSGLYDTANTSWEQWAHNLPESTFPIDRRGWVCPSCNSVGSPGVWTCCWHLKAKKFDKVPQCLLVGGQHHIHFTCLSCRQGFPCQFDGTSFVYVRSQRD